MREIKFRGYNKKREKWYYGFLGKYNFLKEKDYYIDDEFCNNIVEEESIGQFTGFIDKNCKEMYEGDIVIAFSRQQRYKIVWSERHGAWSLESFDAKVIMPYLEGESYEVIGNIYEEKLKKEDK